MRDNLDESRNKKPFQPYRHVSSQVSNFTSSTMTGIEHSQNVLLTRNEHVRRVKIAQVTKDEEAGNRSYHGCRAGRTEKETRGRSAETSKGVASGKGRGNPKKRRCRRGQRNEYV